MTAASVEAFSYDFHMTSGRSVGSRNSGRLIPATLAGLLGLLADRNIVSQHPLRAVHYARVGGFVAVGGMWDLRMVPLSRELATASGQQKAARPDTGWWPPSGRSSSANAASSPFAQRRRLTLARTVICLVRCPPPPLPIGPPSIVAKPVWGLATSVENPSGRCCTALSASTWPRYWPRPSSAIPAATCRSSFGASGCWKARLATKKNFHRGGQLVVRKRIFSSGQLKILGNQPWWTAL